MYQGNLAATSNRIKWAFTVTLTDPSTNLPTSITGAAITLGIRTPGQTSCLLTASTANGKITITNGPGGIFAVSFPASDMKQLDAGEYEVGIVVVSLAGDEYQILAGELPVVDGVIDP